MLAHLRGLIHVAEKVVEGAGVIPQALTRVCENWAVPPGLEAFCPLYPALKRGAKLARPFGTGILENRSHRFDQKSSSHTLSRALRYPKSMKRRDSTPDAATMELL